MLTLKERSDTDNNFNSIAKARVEQATKGVAELQAQLLCGLAEQSCKWHDSKETEAKSEACIPIKVMREEGERNEDEENVEPGVEEEEAVGGQVGGFIW